MVLDWFDASKAKEFGLHLAQFYIDRVPLDSTMTEKSFAKKTQEALDKMIVQINVFKLQHKLNLYKKAQLGNAFKWRLKEAGFPPTHIDKMTKWLILQTS